MLFPIILSPIFIMMVITFPLLLSYRLYSMQILNTLCFIGSTGVKGMETLGERGGLLSFSGLA